jgi:hypothetical protein
MFGGSSGGCLVEASKVLNSVEEVCEEVVVGFGLGLVVVGVVIVVGGQVVVGVVVVGRVVVGVGVGVVVVVVVVVVVDKMTLMYTVRLSSPNLDVNCSVQFPLSNAFDSVKTPRKTPRPRRVNVAPHKHSYY